MKTSILNSVTGGISRYLLAIASLLLLFVPQNSYATIFNLYGTGQGLTAGAGQVDTHWTITSSPSGPEAAYAVTPATPAWINPALIPISGRWDGPALNSIGGNGYASNPLGNYTYQTTFSTNSAETITFSYSSDNAIVSAFVNGIAITGLSNSSTDYGTLMTGMFSVGDAGNYTLTFTVNNLDDHNNEPPNPGNPSGLLVDVSSNNISYTTPEPSTYVLLGSMLGVMGLVSFSRRQKKLNILK